MSLRSSIRAGAATPQALQRARRVLDARGLGEPLNLQWSLSNDVWVLRDRVLRMVRTSESSSAMRREVELLTAMPQEVPAPRICDAGTEDGFAWMLTTRVAGEPLTSVWQVLSPDQRQRAIIQIANLLATMQNRFPTQAVLTTHRMLPEWYQGFYPDIFRSQLISMCDRGRVAPELARTTLRRYNELRETSLRNDLDDIVGDCQGDAHFGNWMWSGSEISGVVDFGDAVLGRRDLDLDKLFWHAYDLGKTDGTGLDSVLSAVPVIQRKLRLDASWTDRLRYYTLVSQVSMGSMRELDDIVGDCSDLIGRVVSGESYIDEIEARVQVHQRPDRSMDFVRELRPRRDE